ncbi:MAG: ribosome silencing factor [candidate division KSB1 bacterium]|nr:ribosome silencing factor [candidate division KSB1 bacterium]
MRKEGQELSTKDLSDPKTLALRIADLSLDKKASSVLVMDLRGLCSFTDYFVLCTGASDTQVKAITDHIEEELSKEHIEPWHREGYTHLRWVILDYIDVVAHIFQPEVREFYGLEQLWGDAEVIEVSEESIGSTRA